MSNIGTFSDSRSLYLLSGFLKPFYNYDSIPLSINSVISGYLLEILMDQYIIGCNSNDYNIQYHCVTCLRKILGLKRDNFLQTSIAKRMHVTIPR